jgi:aminoglycoside 6'-N-acetyltransferase
MRLPVLRAGRVTLRPIEDGDLDALAAAVAAPGVREWFEVREEGPGAPEDLRNEGRAFAIEAEGALAGWLAFDEEDDPGYRHAGIDVFLAPAFQGRGLGSEALRAAIGWLIGERGHHRLTIDPAAHNARAIRTYESVGFRPVGIMRRYERGADGEWHDGLLMDLLADEFHALPSS